MRDGIIALVLIGVFLYGSAWGLEQYARYMSKKDQPWCGCGCDGKCGDKCKCGSGCKCNHDVDGDRE